MVEIDGYKVVPLRLAPDVQNCHSIYMREHFIRGMDPNKPKGRTLFLLNIPPYVNEASLEKYFQKVAGNVVAVSFAAKPGREETDKWHQNITEFTNIRTAFRFKVGYIVFKASSSIAKALAIESIDLFINGTGESTVESGMQLWHSKYASSILDEKEAQARIDAFMTDYDERERVRLEEKRNSEKDADGWTTVGSQGREAGFQQKESTVQRLKGRGSKKELMNFYTFQIRENKMKKVFDLRKKFEEDKRKIELVKQTRRFRPF